MGLTSTSELSLEYRKVGGRGLAGVRLGIVSYCVAFQE